jgi:glycosyltransferase involved in cell wall biosynthesis
LKPFFSIITVTKNSEEKIDSTIKSVLSQTYKNFEYIILDGFSKDQTFKRIKDYSHKNIILYQRKDRSFYEGLNYAIARSRGFFIGILNSGDVYYSESILEKMKKNINKYKNYDFYYSNLLFFNKKMLSTRVWTQTLNYGIVHQAFQIPHPTIFVSKKILQNMKYNVEYKISSDLDFIIRMINNKFQGKYFNFFSICMEEGGMSTKFKNIIRKLKEDLKIHQKHFKIFLFSFILNKILKLRTIFFNKKYKIKKYE